MRAPVLKSLPFLATVIAFGFASPLLHSALAQSAAAAPAPTITVEAPFAEESVVIERSDTVYTYAADGTGFEDRSIVVRIQSDAAVRALGVISVAFAANSQHVEFLYARVRHPDGTVVESPSADAIEMPQPVTREAPFYSDLKEKQLPIRSLRAGDTLEWKARITTTKSEAPGQFWGQDTFIDDTVALAETIELRVPASLSVNVWSPTSKPVESVADGMHVYHWTSSQLKPTVGKLAEIAADLKKKTVWTADQELDSDQGKLPAIAWTTFKSWEDVGAWYRSLATDRSTAGPEIKAKVADLIAGKSTDEDKVRALYAYVATQIHYIGVDFGIGRFQPHTATEILANQYGDCKDKHTLLAAMLSAAGIQSDAVLIGAGIRFNTAVPSPSAFNHVITHLTVAGQPVWLDSTAEIAPYRMLINVTRDKQALVIPATGAIHVERTPADPPFPSFQNMDAVGSIDKDGVAHSRLTFTVRGDTELVVRSAFHQTSPGQYNQVVQQISYGIGYGGTTSNADISRPEDTAGPFKMSYDYVREKTGDWDNYKIIPQVAPISIPRPGDADPLIHNLDLGTPRIETSHASMKIPDGWTAILPEAVHIKSIYATYDETYRFEKGTIYTERRVEILKQKVPTADLKTYKKWTDDTDLGSEFYIQLVRHDADAKPSPSTGATPGTTISVHADPASGTDAAKLIEQAYADIEKNDLYNAKAELDQARKLNPEQEFLWNTSGYLLFRNGDQAGALDDYKKELALHPAAFQRMYPPIISLQLLTNHRKDAMASLRAWSKSDPVDPAPVAQLLALLIEDDDAKTAVAEGEAALTRLPADGKNEFVRIQLGQAYILAGDKQKGAAMLRPILQQTQDPGILNDTAYTLADASLELPLDETSTRTALDKLDEESNSWTLDEDPQTLRAKSQLIVATWDTLGWILYREGKLDEAQSYIQAGWLGEPNIDTGKHLGDILAARGNKAAALNTYDLAIATVSGYDALGVRKEPSEKQKKVQALADTLRPANAKSTGPTSPAKLLELRTIPLGAANGRSGQAEYRLLLKNGKAVRIVPTGDKSVPGADDSVSKANFSSYFPTGSHATLVRAGFVNCHSKVCELVLEP